MYIMLYMTGEVEALNSNWGHAAFPFHQRKPKMCAKGVSEINGSSLSMLVVGTSNTHACTDTCQSVFEVLGGKHQCSNLKDELCMFYYDFVLIPRQ